MASRIFLAFSGMDEQVGKEYVRVHRDALVAAGASLEMQMIQGSAVMRLSLPESLAKVNPADMLPDMLWRPVREQVVSVQRPTVDIDELEGNE